jgi:hypothetical protein
MTGCNCKLDFKFSEIVAGNKIFETPVKLPSLRNPLHAELGLVYGISLGILIPDKVIMGHCYINMGS